MRLFNLKKPSLDSDDLSYYRPIVLSPIALSLVSKWVERAVHAQLLLYINDNDFYPSLQSVDQQFIDRNCCSKGSN